MIPFNAVLFFQSKIAFTYAVCLILIHFSFSEHNGGQCEFLLGKTKLGEVRIQTLLCILKVQHKNIL